MNRLIALLFLLPAISGCSYKSRTIQLFNGTTLDGWYAYTDDGKQPDAAQVFSVTDSMIRLYGNKVGYLMSTKSYTDFELSLEFRWNTEQKYYRGPGIKNSGIMYNVPEETPDRFWPAGIQYQVKEEAVGDFILLGNVTMEVRGIRPAPGSSVVIPRISGTERKAGEWNQIVIQSYKGKCSQYLNGELVNEGINPSSAGGRILLQYEGSPIDFRRIILKHL